MNVFYFCNGNDPECSRENCWFIAGQCCHTTNKEAAYPCDGVRVFEEYDPDSLFEIDMSE